MDNVLIQLIARLKIRLRQEKKLSLNSQKFFSDTNYARQVLDVAEDSEDLELVSLSLELRGRLGWINIPADTTTSAPTSASAPGKSIDKGRYIFGARS